MIARANAVRSVIEPYEEATSRIEEAGFYIEMADSESDPDQRNTALLEALKGIEKTEKQCDALELRSLLGEPLDAKSAYLGIHAGAGGTESCDWADMLMRMYTRYAERAGFEIHVLDYQPGDEAGVKNAVLHITGPFAYGYLKAERGVHRLVRISPFDSNKRRHTSFVAVDVSAELDEEVEIEIDEKDLRVDTFRAAGAGGQHVNKTDSAVRIVHQPSGIVVSCQAERSQHSNRDRCMKMLKARLYEREQDRQREEREKVYGEKGEIAWGRQIRSYVLQPYTLVKDDRTEVEIGNVNGVLDGDIQPFIEAYLRRGRKA